VLIYVEYITERLLYTLSFVFKDRKVAYQLTNDGIAFIAEVVPNLTIQNANSQIAFKSFQPDSFLKMNAYKRSLYRAHFLEQPVLNLTKQQICWPLSFMS